MHESLFEVYVQYAINLPGARKKSRSPVASRSNAAGPTYLYVTRVQRRSIARRYLLGHHFSPSGGIIPADPRAASFSWPEEHNAVREIDGRVQRLFPFALVLRSSPSGHPLCLLGVPSFLFAVPPLPRSLAPSPIYKHLRVLARLESKRVAQRRGGQPPTPSIFRLPGIRRSYKGLWYSLHGSSIRGILRL